MMHRCRELEIELGYKKVASTQPSDDASADFDQKMKENAKRDKAKIAASKK